MAEHRSLSCIWTSNMALLVEDVYYFQVTAISFLFWNDPPDILPTDDNGDPRFDNLSIMACYDFGVQYLVGYTRVEIKA